MKYIYRAWLFIALISAISLSGCKPAASTQQPTVKPTALPPGITREMVTALDSLVKVDEYPLYTMHQSGEYPGITSEDIKPETDFSCALFSAMGDEKNRIYGRNFDWYYSPALMLFYDPPDGYASVSMVDLAYLGVEEETASGLADLPLEERLFLLNAVYLPFDGMNEAGLAIGMAAVFESVSGYDSTKESIGSVEIIREVLDHASSVSEAIALFASYNIDFGGEPPIHYLVADRSGESALIEFVDGEMVVLPNENPWQVATNHLRATAVGSGGCNRYLIIDDRLEDTGGRMDFSSSMDVLYDTGQPDSTQWSIVYNMTTGEMHIALDMDLENIYSFTLEQLP